MGILPTRLLLYVDASGVTASLRRGRRRTGLGTFANDAGGHAAFRKIAVRHDAAPAFITVESFDEDYSIQKLPSVSRRDRAAVLERKLAQLHPHSPYRGASALPRAEGSASTMQYLVAALTDDRILAPWLDVLRDAGCCIAGVYPLAVILLALVPESSRQSRATLLVARHARSLRFLFVVGGALRTHRLTPLPAAYADSSVLAREIHRTLAYLVHSGQLPEGADLDCAHLGIGSTEAIEHGSPIVRLRLLDASSLTTRLGCSATDVQAVVLALLGRRPPHLNLAPAASLRRYRTEQRRNALHRVTVSVFVSSVATVALGLQRLDTLAAERHALNAELARATLHVEHSFPDRMQAKDITRMETILAEARRLRESARLPHHALLRLARVLDRHTLIVLEHLEWRSSLHEARSADASASPLESLILALSIVEPEDDLDRADSLNAFLAALRQLEGVTRLRLHHASTTPSSEHRPGMATGHRPPFTVEIEMGPSR